MKTLEQAIHNSSQYTGLLNVLDIVIQSGFKTATCEKFRAIILNYEDHKDMHRLAVDLFNLDNIPVALTNKNKLVWMGNIGEDVPLK